MENTIVQGTPSMVMLPASNYSFKVEENELVIEIPKSGSYAELAPDIFGKESGEFNLMDKDVLYLPSLSKILFATNKYPDLGPNQFFAPYLLVFGDDTVTIVGQVIEHVVPEDAYGGFI